MPTNIITSTHLKGGTGTTVITFNLALSIANEFPSQVLFIQLTKGADMQALLSTPQKYSFEDIRSFLDENELNESTLRSLCAGENGLDVISLPADVTSNYDLKEQMFMDIINICKKTYQYIFIDCPPLEIFTIPVFNISDFILYFTHLDLPSVQLLNEYRKFASLHSFENKMLLIVNQIPKGMSTYRAEKILGSKILSGLPSDTEAFLETVTLAKPYALNKKYRLTKATHKLRKKLNDLTKTTYFEDFTETF